MEFVRTEEDDGVLKITITRENALNALNQQVLEELNQALDEVSASTRVVVITGAGDRAFVAGADISAMVKMSPLEAREFLTYGQRFLDRIETLPVPVIGVVNGYALGGGMELALACDIRIATDNAVLGLPEVTLGLIPSFGGTQRLTRAVGTAVAKSMILTAKRIRAQEAKDLGLVDFVGTKEEVSEELNKMVSKLKGLAPVALRAAKDAVYAASNMDIISGQELEVNYASMCFATDDLREGMNAFLEKRKANFQGK